MYRISRRSMRVVHLRHCRIFSTASKGPSMNPNRFNEETDVLVIGSGAGALTAALRSKSHGARVIVVEKESVLGGASAISGGGLWIPCNPVSRDSGIRDSKEGALKYFEQAVGDVGPASSAAKRHAYLDNGPEMVEFLQDQGFQFHFSRGYPDYHPDLEGAMGEQGGRSIESKPFDLRKLGKWESALPSGRAPLAIHTNDAPVFARMTSSVGAFVYAMKKAIPLILRGLSGQKLTSMGHGLVAQLLHLNLQKDMDIRLNTAFNGLIQGPDGEVLGAQVKTESGISSIKASKGVILAAGGFAKNMEMRKQYLPSPVSTDWTSSPNGDTGDAISEGLRVGAATALMDDAWWGPTIIDPVTSKPSFALFERARPHCIIVDESGKRFMNEAQPYTEAGHDQYHRNKLVKAIPAWLIMDVRHRNSYMLGTQLFARMKPTKALERGDMFAAGTLEELARLIDVDDRGLRITVDKFNSMCESGVDKDFGKGGNAYDRFFGDPKVGPNPNLGSIARAPFYAMKIWPGDLGTKGGLLTDEFQRVINADGEPIRNLFAIGNTAASIMGRTYLGAGATLGPAMTHGYIAADYLAGRKE